MIVTAKEKPGRERLAGLAAFLPVFQAPGFSFGEWGGGEKTESGAITMPYFALSEEASAFVHAAYDLGWVLEGFDWPKWKDTQEAQSLLEPSVLADATPEQLAQLLTTLIRQDRFVEGGLASAFKSGLLTRILERANRLLKELDAQPAAREG